MKKTFFLTISCSVQESDYSKDKYKISTISNLESKENRVWVKKKLLAIRT